MTVSTTLCAAVISHMVMNSATQYLPQGQLPYPSMPGHMPINIGAPMPMPYPQNLAMQQSRLPVMVMPYHSKAADKKHKPHKRRKEKKYLASSSTSTSDSDETSSSAEYYRRSFDHRRGKRKRQVLTPVISYVTNNGRVVYQKKIDKESVGDWLGIGQGKGQELHHDETHENNYSHEMTIRDLKNRYGLKKKHTHEH